MIRSLPLNPVLSILKYHMPVFVLVDLVLEKKVMYISCMLMRRDVEISGLEVLLR